MDHPLNILLLEDNRTDAEIIHRFLKKQEMVGQFRHAIDKKSFETALTEFHPDIILSDHALPQFNSTDALQLARKVFPDIPFIMVTGSVSEEFAAEIMKIGADDYILKDRMSRLPAAILTALRERRTRKEVADYKYALDQSSDVTITDLNGMILYANENFCKISKYSEAELLGKSHRITNSGYHGEWFMQDLWKTISEGNIWQGEICNKSKDGTIYWQDTTIVPFLDQQRKPYQYLAIRKDITDRKKLEADLLEQQRKQQIRITATALEAQEKERTAIGYELHDNVNQLLVGSNLILSMVLKKPDDTLKLVETAMSHIKNAIRENRKIAHVFVTPDFESGTLVEQLKKLTEQMLKPIAVKTIIMTEHLDERLLNDERKVNIYRIAQEQCTNIVKYSKCTEVVFRLRIEEKEFCMSIADNGVGSDTSKKSGGIGLRNITGRLSIFGGSSRIVTAPGNGFTLEITIPL